MKLQKKCKIILHLVSPASSASQWLFEGIFWHLSVRNSSWRSLCGPSMVDRSFLYGRADSGWREFRLNGTRLHLFQSNIYRMSVAASSEGSVSHQLFTTRLSLLVIRTYRDTIFLFLFNALSPIYEWSRHFVSLQFKLTAIENKLVKLSFCSDKSETKLSNNRFLKPFLLESL